MPQDEERRQAATLEAMRHLDLGAEEGIRRILRLTGRAMDTSMAAFNLLDGSELRTRIAFGMEPGGYCRDQSFCGHTISGAGTMVVRDTLEDPRFTDNPLVVGFPHIRFYAGAPVRSPEGLAVGTLCVLDRIPREFGEREVRYLEDGAALVEEYVRCRLTRHSAPGQRVFLENIGHEMRTPMNGVLGISQMLLRSELSPEQRQYVGIIRDAAGSLLELVNNLLDQASLDAGRFRLVRRGFELHPILRETVDLLRPQAQAKGLELGLEIRDDGAGRLLGDPLRLRQVLRNLVGNAVKFTERGRVLVNCITTPSGNGRERMEVAIRDTGVGIAPDRLEAIFERFAQADPATSARFGGTGLGLAISRELLRLMGGDLSVESELGKGTVARFALTLETAEPEPVPVTAPAARPAQSGQAPPRLLVVDDNTVNLMVAKGMLQKMGYRVETAKDGREAVELWGSGAFALVLMDCVMPVMDGFEATREIRRREAGLRRTPIVALTASVLAENADDCYRAGMDDFMSKPVKFEGLRDVAAKWVAAGTGGREDETAAGGG